MFSIPAGFKFHKSIIQTAAMTFLMKRIKFSKSYRVPCGFRVCTMQTSSDVSSCMCNDLAYQRLRSSILEQGYRDRDTGIDLTRDAEA